ncbi:hypothetical protein C8R45DRAFT_936308 [Mycena sanguinolenta]|nr:hypothetical protein C8R45DRAFT_936308 [Mycena sanguinolenta]
MYLGNFSVSCRPESPPTVVLARRRTRHLPIPSPTSYCDSATWARFLQPGTVIRSETSRIESTGKCAGYGCTEPVMTFIFGMRARGSGDDAEMECEHVLQLARCPPQRLLRPSLPSQLPAPTARGRLSVLPHWGRVENLHGCSSDGMHGDIAQWAARWVLGKELKGGGMVPLGSYSPGSQGRRLDLAHLAVVVEMEWRGAGAMLRRVPSALPAIPFPALHFFSNFHLRRFFVESTTGLHVVFPRLGGCFYAAEERKTSEARRRSSVFKKLAASAQLVRRGSTRCAFIYSAAYKSTIVPTAWIAKWIEKAIPPESSDIVIPQEAKKTQT